MTWGLHLAGVGADGRPSHKRRMTLSQDRWTAVLVIVLALMALAVAYGAQIGLGMAPCELCFWERWPYRIALALGVLALLFPGGLGRLLLWLAALAFLADVGIAGLHVGVEQGWWPSPFPACSAANIFKGNLSSLMANLPATPAKPCDAPNFLIPGLPLSFTTMDFLYALICFVLVTGILGAAPRRRR
jgi:disulfide bond formation protein DsbB